MKRIFWLTLLFTAVTWAGCSNPPTDSSYSPTASHQAMASTADSEGTHQDNAVAAVNKAKAIAGSIPDAAPVVPPLNSASIELEGAKADNGKLKDQIAVDQTAVTTQATQLSAANAKVKTLTDKNAALKKQWDTSWLGGKFWLWFKVVTGVFSLVFIGLFLAEFVAGWNIHPITWLIEAVGWVISNFIPAAINGVKYFSTYVSSLFKKLFAKKATATPPSVAPPALPVPGPTVVATK